uniref:glutamate-rich protein 1 isoform X1 n=2 Tax=Monopterus albus TaxID=43700 RepID=UPI0009B2F4EF|nr:glutamate-rich protein 1 isoform X1 [Monopterus albus]
MAHRKEVFLSKVLQKLYPAALIVEEEPSPAQAGKTYMKGKACQGDTASATSVSGDAGQTQSAASSSRRMYTVLPAPAETHSEKSFIQIESRNNAKGQAEEIVHDSNEELDKDNEQEEQKRKRRRRKRKPTPHQDSEQDGAAAGSESSRSQFSQAPVDEGGGCISKNKKRKLKKKRHKEKLLSMGLVPRAAALEFMYQKDGEVEDNQKRAAEVSDFLRTTLEIYLSDSSLHVDKPSLLSGTVDELLRRISSGGNPTLLLKQLCSLKAFVQEKETDKLKEALEELYCNSFMSEEETSAVSLLFQYWMTDILPMKGAKNTQLSSTHP